MIFQLGIVVERGNEPADFPVPFLRGAVGKLIFDHEMFHRLLLGRRIMDRAAPQSGAGRSDNASMDKNDTIGFVALACILKRATRNAALEMMTWQRRNQRQLAGARSRRSKK
jgi:hypothetical protein